MVLTEKKRDPANAEDQELTRLFAPGASSPRGSEIRELLKLLGQPDVISFAGGIPAPALFPAEAIEQAFGRVLSAPDIRATALQYAVTEGHVPLRRWIVGRQPRGDAPGAVEDVIVTSGSQQALDLLARLFIGRGDAVAITRPGYLGALQVFGYSEARIIGIPEDGEGIMLPPLRDALEGGAKLVYLVPDFNNPTGISLSRRRREQAVELACAYGVPFIEDLAYAHLRYEGEKVPSLAALADAMLGEKGRHRNPVVQIGTFSKSICPGLRTGWVRAARSVIERLTVLKQGADLHSSTLNQMVLADILPARFDACVDVQCRTYKARKDAMLGALARHFPHGVSWTRPEGGFFVWVTLPDGLAASELLKEAVQEYKTAFVPGSAFYADGGGRSSLRLSFSLNEIPQIYEGLERLGRLLRRHTRAHARSNARPRALEQAAGYLRDPGAEKRP